jgi:hypothetical protein
MTKGKVIMPAMQRVAVLGCSLLLFAVSQQANAQQKMEFKFNLKDIFKTDNVAGQPAPVPAGQTPVPQEQSPSAGDSQPVANEAPRPIQRRPDTESASHSADGADKTSKGYWETQFWNCVGELKNMQASGQLFPPNDCATTLEAEFMRSGLADSKIACLDQAKRDYGKADRIGREPPSMSYVMKTGQKHPGSSKSASMGPFMTNKKMLTRHNEEVAKHRCNQDWPYRSLYMSWDKMRIARDDVRGAMNTAHRHETNRQELDALINEENAALAKWRNSPRSRGAKIQIQQPEEMGFTGVVIGDKSGMIHVEYEVCTKTEMEEVNGELVEECTRWGRERQWFSSAVTYPSGWDHGGACRWKFQMYGDMTCWRERRDENMRRLR